MKKALIILLCVLLALSACGEASPDPTSAPAQETQAAVTRMVSEPVAADFFARVTDVCGGELYAMPTGPSAAGTVRCSSRSLSLTASPK